MKHFETIEIQSEGHTCEILTTDPHCESHQGNVLDVFHPGGSQTRQRTWRKHLQSCQDQGLGKTGRRRSGNMWQPLGVGVPWEPHQVAGWPQGRLDISRHLDFCSASQPQIGLSCHRFPVASIKTAMVRVLSFVLPCHGWQIGVGYEKDDCAILGTID